VYNLLRLELTEKKIKISACSNLPLQQQHHEPIKRDENKFGKKAISFVERKSNRKGGRQQ